MCMYTFFFENVCDLCMVFNFPSPTGFFQVLLSSQAAMQDFFQWSSERCHVYVWFSFGFKPFMLVSGIYSLDMPSVSKAVHS